MESIAKFAGICAAGIGTAFIFIIISSLMGGISGWVVGLVFGDTILGIAAQIGIKDVTMFQLGLFLGFVGGFLRTKVDVKGIK